MSANGTRHWIIQRITAVLALPLTFWLCWSIIGLVHADHAVFTWWLSQPLNAGLMIVTIITLFYHAMLGCEVIIDDYLHTPWFKTVKLIGMKIVLAAACLACIYAVLKVAL